MMRKTPCSFLSKPAIAFFAVCFFAVAALRAEDMRTIEGQIFIRTKGAETFKLSLVEVQLLDEKTIASHLSKKRKIAEPLLAELEPLLIEAKAAKASAEEIEQAASDAYFKSNKAYLEEPYELAEKALKQAENRFYNLSGASAYMASTSYYFQGLPEPLQVTKTDADGKFTFQAKRGTYVLAAMSSRNAGVDVIGNTSFPRVEFYSWLVKVVLIENKKVMLANDNLSTGDSPDSLIVAGESEPSKYDIAYVAKVIAEEKQAVAADVEAEKQAADAARQEAAKKEAEKARKEREADLAVFRKNPKAAQQKAIQLFPDIGVAGSPLNKEFVDRAKRYQIEKKEFFAEQDWPVRLAKECSEALGAKDAPK
jgi:hypothetical protein